MKRIFILIFGVLSSITDFAQHQELNESPGLWKEKEKEVDSTSILSAFRKGTFSGHFRYYFMATNNRSGLTDYYANAIGGGIKFETARFKNFQLGISGFFTYNIGSSDLTKPDPETNQMNRYEIGLFDIQDPSNKKDIDRLEELYIKYHFRKNQITIGKQLINTPFINLQDGRMRPTEVEGIWTEINSLKKIRLQIGYIYGISPRSTIKWFNVDESIGVYPVGVNTSGVKSGYAGKLDSKGIILAGIQWKLNDQLKLQGWNQLTLNIFNSALLQLDYEYQLKNKSKIFAAAQLIRQDAIGNGGNKDQSIAYIEKGSKTITFGNKVGWKNNKWETSISYNRITAKGRYLMPREWGRDPFFTFMPRERNEGLGDVNAIVGKVNYKFIKARIHTSVAFGYYDLPEVSNYKLNKYGMPSYTQFNFDTRYKFNGLLKGLEIQILFIHKGKTGNSYDNQKFVINKVDMSHWNIVLNYQF